MLGFRELCSDNSIWLAIIAINMTIIGLTSLADSKTIIGVDYGKFLIKKYRLFLGIRMYNLLIIFALVNVVSLLMMFTPDLHMRMTIFVCLLVSLIFAIKYFFSYILIENIHVKKQIYKEELLGMYYDSDDRTNFQADIVSGMSNGWRTDKRLSSNIIMYFNTFNTDAQIAFEESFGPNSIIYDRDKRAMRYWEKRLNKQPYRYEIKKGINHISHEFFQLYRYTELQDKWLLEILRLYNEDYLDKNPEIRLINVLRILAHVNRFGKSESLFQYKFLDYLSKYIISALKIDQHQCTSQYKEREIFLYNELFSYILSTLNKTHDNPFFSSSIELTRNLFGKGTNIGSVIINERLVILFKLYGIYSSEIVENYMLEVFDIYSENDDIPDKKSTSDIAKILSKLEGSQKKIKTQREQLFPR